MRILMSAVVALALCVPALAQDDEGTGEHGMMGPGGMMGGHQGPGHMCHIVGSGHHMEGTLAFLKTELKITTAQAGAWDGFASAFKAVQSGEHGQHQGPGHKKMERKGPAPLTERMSYHEKMMEAHLAQMKKMHGVMRTLYETLNAGQKQMADELLPAFMMCRMRG